MVMDSAIDMSRVSLPSTERCLALPCRVLPSPGIELIPLLKSVPGI